MLPKVIIHNAVSLDGRITGFDVDLELYYEIATGFGEDATLVGSGTMLTSGDEIPEETEEDIKKPKPKPDDDRSILAIPDSKGRVRIWHALRRWPYWRDHVALITKNTPKDYIEYLEKRSIDYIVAGSDKVDLKTALERLNARFGVKLVRVDSGGTLNGVLLRAGLVDEVSILLHHTLVGRKNTISVFKDDGQTSDEGVIKLKLLKFEKLKDDIVWLRYEVVK
jgi:2,5-diamino-6-(ribosylamino)-4(3H)-pyrimidinone 5'-phosphate reductase